MQVREVNTVDRKIIVHGDKFIFNLNLTDKVKNADLGLTRLEIQKLDRVVQNVKKFIHPGMLHQLSVKKFKRRKSIDTFFYHSMFIQKKFFSKAMRQLITDRQQNIPPLDFSPE